MPAIGIGVGIPFAFSSLAAAVAALFAAGQQGAVNEPSDFATLSQDSAGTTPVTTVEQSIGLMLDKRLGLVRGAEMVTNGDFSSSVGWTIIGAGTAISGGVLSFTGSAVNDYVDRAPAAAFVAGDLLEVTYTILSITGSVRVQAAGIAGINRNTAGTFTQNIFAINGNNLAVVAASAGVNAVIDNYSIKKILGNHLSQATAASRPILRQDASLKYFGFNDGIDDSMSTTTGGGSTAGYFLCQGIRPTAGAGTIRTIWSDEQANAGYRVRLNAANQLELSSGSGTPLAPPVQSAATTSTTGGTGLAASTAYFYVITALNAKGESLKSNEVNVTTGLGTTNSNSLSWAAAAGATDYRVYRGLATGAQDVFYVTGNVLAFTDTGAAATAGAPPLVSETAYTVVATAASTVIGTTSLLTVWDDGTNLNAQLGSGAVASVARTVVAAGTAGFTAGKRNGAAAGFFTGNLYADVYRQIAPNATERLQVQRYVADKSGVLL